MALPPLLEAENNRYIQGIDFKNSRFLEDSVEISERGSHQGQAGSRTVTSDSNM